MEDVLKLSSGRMKTAKKIPGMILIDQNWGFDALGLLAFPLASIRRMLEHFQVLVAQHWRAQYIILDEARTYVELQAIWQQLEMQKLRARLEQRMHVDVEAAIGGKEYRHICKCQTAANADLSWIQSIQTVTVRKNLQLPQPNRMQIDTNANGDHVPSLSYQPSNYIISPIWSILPLSDCPDNDKNLGFPGREASMSSSSCLITGRNFQPERGQSYSLSIVVTSYVIYGNFLFRCEILHRYTQIFLALLAYCRSA